MNSCDGDLYDELRRLEREAGLGQGAWRHARRLKQQLRRDRVTHLRSIHLDAETVREVHASLGQPPVLANLRCGVWYVPPDLSAGACYFKSTDGHVGHWGFSLSRINLSAALAAAEHGTVLVVDATRSGKRFPDALTKTVPIWCCVINRAVAQRRGRGTQPSSGGGGGGGSSCWDCSLHLPPWVPPSEASQIERVLDRAVASLLCGAMASIVDRLDAALPAPLAPFWLAAGEPFAAPPRDGRTCWVVCLSASRVASAQDARELHSWHYVQGAGDDEENWTRGLSAAQWWRWAAPVLRLAELCSHAAAEAELARLQEEEAGGGDGADLRHAEGSDGGAGGGGGTGLGGAVALWDSGLLLGDAAAALAMASTPGVALLNMGSPVAGDSAAATARPPGANAYCHRPVHVGKSAQPRRDHWQVSVLPAAIRFAHSRLEKGERLLVYCERGDDRAPTVAAAILLALYTEDGRQRRPPPPARELFGRDDARTRLALVQGAYPAARVPRAMLKEVWNFFTAQGCGWQTLDFIVVGGAGAEEEAPAG